MRKKLRSAVFLLTFFLLLLMLLGCQTTPQLTLGQRFAIYRVESIYRTYDRNFSARDEIIELIQETNRNINVLVELAEFAAMRGSNTVLYIRLARYASRSRYASSEFADIARKIRPDTRWIEWEHVAEALADAESKDEVRRLRREYL